MVELRLEPGDEYTHPVESDRSFNESMYFNAYDPALRLGGFFRLGNRANEGYAEMTVCLFLPDGRVAFAFDRPTIADNGAFGAGGLRFEIVKPFEEQEIQFEGSVVLLEDPLDMAEPRTAFSENPLSNASIYLSWRGNTHPFGGELVDDEGHPLARSAHERAFARGHYEQHGAASGAVRIGEQSWELNGLGLRDHSWGPRSWQSPWWYRWLTANFANPGDGLGGFMLSVIAGRDGSRRIGGMVLQDGEYRVVDDVDVETDWDETASGPMQRRIRAHARTTDRDYEVHGRVLNLIPLRHRKQNPDGTEALTRISEGLTEWRCDGEVGYGLAEYLDQIVDGRPAGAVP